MPEGVKPATNVALIFLIGSIISRSKFNIIRINQKLMCTVQFQAFWFASALLMAIAEVPGVFINVSVRE